MFLTFKGIRGLGGPGCEKTLLQCLNHKGGDQPVHSHSLIRAFVIRILGSIISRLATSKIKFF